MYDYYYFLFLSKDRSMEEDIEQEVISKQLIVSLLMSREYFIVRDVLKYYFTALRNYRVDQTLSPSSSRHRVDFVKIVVRLQRLQQRAFDVPAEFHVSQQL